jgi:hypothetical protein
MDDVPSTSSSKNIGVAACCTSQRIVTQAAVKQIIAGTAVEGVVTGSAKEGIVSRIRRAYQVSELIRVKSTIAGKNIVVFPAIEIIISAGSMQLITSLASK